MTSLKMDSLTSDAGSSSDSDSASNCSEKDINGQALHLIRFEKSETDEFIMHLNEETMNKVLSSTENRPLAILSVAGPVRQGKSFLLNYALRSLEAMENDQTSNFEDPDWMDWQNKSKALTGFAWDHGMKPVTKGVWVWSRAFLVEGEEDDIAVLLLDTQGFDEDDAPTKEILTTIGLCMLTSSMTILNFSNNLPDDVQKLSAFLKYGLHCSESDEGEETPFQNLTFLIRDWNNPSQHAFGMKGGKAYFNEKLQILKAGAKGKAGKELKKMRESFQKCFRNVDCCLLPNIGEGALKQSSTGAVADLSSDFSKFLETFINHVISTEGLHIKKILGTDVTAAEFKYFLPAYVSLLNSWNEGELELTPEEIWNVTGNVSHEIIVNKSMEKFHEVFEKGRKGKQYLQESDMEIGLAKAKRQAQMIFKKAKKLEEFQSEHEQNLEKKLKQTFQIIKKENEKQRSGFVTNCIQEGSHYFRQELDDSFPCVKKQFQQDEDIVFYEDNAIKEKANGVLKTAKEVFTNNFFEEEEIMAALEKSFEEVLQSILESFLASNRRNMGIAEGFMEQAVQTLVEEYTTEINDHVKENPSIESDTLQHVNKVVVKGMLKKFAQLKMPGRRDFKQKYEVRFKDLVEQMYSRFDRSQSTKIEEQRAKAEELLKTQKNDYLRTLKTLAEQVESEEELLNKHRRSLPKLRESFGERNPFPEGSPQREKLNTQLEEQFESLYEQVREDEFVKKREFQESCENGLSEGLRLYKETFDKLNEGAEFMEENVININHVNSSEKVLEYFEEILGRMIKSNAQKEIANDYLGTLRERIQETFEQIQIQNDQAQERAILAAEALVVDCVKKYDEGMKQSAHSCSKLDQLEQNHREAEAKVVQFFTQQCIRKGKRLTDKYVAELSTEINLNFDEVKNIFEMRHKKEDLEIKEALEEIRKKYHSDMTAHFQNNQFITPTQLQEHHETACKAAVNNCPSKKNFTQSQNIKLEKLLGQSFVKYKTKNEMFLNWDPNVEPAIGIDLGTTYSCAAVFYRGRVHIIPNDLGSNTTPSYVAFNDDGSTTIGQPAKDNSYRNPENTIFDAKRIIGRSFNDPILQNDMKFWPFEVVPGDPESPGPAINIRGTKYPPEKISAILLTHFKQMAEKFLKDRVVKKAVITVPAYFSDGQRQATRDAGEIAGLEVLTILNEPTAAAIAYQMERFDEEARQILIFDLGGGTFDVAILETVGGEIKVVGVDGDTHLGGEDFDKKMMEHCVEEFEQLQDIDLFEEKDSPTKIRRDAARQRLRRLQTYCEKSKKEIAAALASKVSIDGFINGVDLQVKIKRSKFENLNLELFQKAIDIVDRALSTAGIRKESIDDIVLVGGSTRIPKVQEMLRDYFNGRALNFSIHPDEAVAYGAAVQAALLNGSKAKEILGFTSIQDVTPMSLGIEAVINGMRGRFSPIIPKNSRFPTKVSEPYGTHAQGQTTAAIKIYQGEDPVAKNNALLGQFVLEGIPPAGAGREEIDINMEIDAMGIVHVKAVIKSTQGSKGLTVISNKGRLTDEAKMKWREEAAGITGTSFSGRRITNQQLLRSFPEQEDFTPDTSRSERRSQPPPRIPKSAVKLPLFQQKLKK